MGWAALVTQFQIQAALRCAVPHDAGKTLRAIVACVSRFALVTQTENQTVRLL